MEESPRFSRGDDAVVRPDAAEPRAERPLERERSRWRPSSGPVAIVAATAVLFLVSAVLQPQSVSHSSLVGMLPFAAILAIAAAGQTLVIQQGGIDLSVPGAISLVVIIMTRYPNGDNGKLVAALLIAFGVAVVAGLFTGFVVSKIGITAIVTTLGMNALLNGVNFQISQGTSRTTTSDLHDFVTSKVAGIPMTVVIAIVITAIVGFVVKRTVLGRRFEATGGSARVARAAGLEPMRYQVLAYAGAYVLYCVAGILLAGVLSTPNTTQGDAYLLTTVAAVVLGGTSLLGGRGSVVGTAVAALFLTQLTQFVITTGASSAVQNLVQALALALGVAVYSVPWGRVRAWARSRGERAGEIA